MTHLTFVKKILADGSPCKKCAEVNERMNTDGVLNLIDHIAIAVERDVDSEGMRLAVQYQARRAPFFILQEGDQAQMFDVYFKCKDALQQRGLLQAAKKTV